MGVPQQNPNTPSTAVDDSRYMRQGMSKGPYGNDPFLDARGEFGEPAEELKNT